VQAVGNWSGINDVIRYMAEMWRLLTINGTFILISAAPKDILKSLMVDRLQLHKCSNWPQQHTNSHSSSSSSSSSNNHSSGVYTPITTTVGETVYYYAIRKEEELCVSLEELLLPTSRVEADLQEKESKHMKSA
jgi:hypothetical protein